jgi:hypothetical protein
LTVFDPTIGQFDLTSKLVARKLHSPFRRHGGRTCPRAVHEGHEILVFVSLGFIAYLRKDQQPALRLA